MTARIVFQDLTNKRIIFAIGTPLIKFKSIRGFKTAFLNAVNKNMHNCYMYYGACLCRAIAYNCDTGIELGRMDFTLN